MADLHDSDGHDRRAFSLASLVDAAKSIPGVRRGELAAGERLLVATRNSFYSLTALEDGEFLVAGGWYERHGCGQVQVGVRGCTIGGHALLRELIAAPGLFLELADGTTTTRIRRVRRLPPLAD